MHLYSYHLRYVHRGFMPRFGFAYYDMMVKEDTLAHHDSSMAS